MQSLGFICLIWLETFAILNFLNVKYFDIILSFSILGYDGPFLSASFNRDICCSLPLFMLCKAHYVRLLSFPTACWRVFVSLRVTYGDHWVRKWTLMSFILVVLAPPFYFQSREEKKNRNFVVTAWAHKFRVLLNWIDLLLYCISCWSWERKKKCWNGKWSNKIVLYWRNQWADNFIDQNWNHLLCALICGKRKQIISSSLSIQKLSVFRRLIVYILISYFKWAI